MKKTIFLFLSLIVVVLSYLAYLGSFKVDFDSIYPDIDSKSGDLALLIKDAKPLMNKYNVIVALTVQGESTWDFTSSEIKDYVGKKYISKIKSDKSESEDFVGYSDTSGLLRYSVCNIYLNATSDIYSKLSFYHELGHCILANRSLSGAFEERVKSDLKSKGVEIDTMAINRTKRRRNEVNAMLFSAYEWYNMGYFKTPQDGLAYQCQIYSKFGKISSSTYYRDGNGSFLGYPLVGDIFNCDIVSSYIRDRTDLLALIEKRVRVDSYSIIESFMLDESYREIFIKEL